METFIFQPRQLPGSMLIYQRVDDIQFIDDFPQRTLHLHQKDLMGMAEGNDPDILGYPGVKKIVI